MEGKSLAKEESKLLRHIVNVMSYQFQDKEFRLM